VLREKSRQEEREREKEREREREREREAEEMLAMQKAREEEQARTVSSESGQQHHTASGVAKAGSFGTSIGGLSVGENIDGGDDGDIAARAQSGVDDEEAKLEEALNAIRMKRNVSLGGGHAKQASREGVSGLLDVSTEGSGASSPRFKPGTPTVKKKKKAVSSLVSLSVSPLLVLSFPLLFSPSFFT